MARQRVNENQLLLDLMLRSQEAEGKVCYACQKFKLFKDFSKDRKRCRVCNYLKVVAWRKRSKALVRKQGKRYRKKHFEQIRKRISAYGKKNREKINLIARKYRQRLIAEGQREIIKGWHRKCVLKNPEKWKIRTHNINIIRQRLHKATPIDPLDWIRLKARHRGKCFYCDEAGKLTLDHFIPISKGGEHRISNIVPACGKCNSRKKDKDPVKFLKEIA